MNEEKIENDFNKLIGTIDDNTFWAYVREWFDEDYILDIMNEWDIETKEQAIKDIKKIMKGGISK
jgi:hypothetical protein